jgi:cell division protein FtsQ
MELPGAGKQKYSFPVIVGMNPGEPLSTRAARMRIYNDLLRQLDSDGGHYSQDLSEVDISDQEDVKVMANDPAGAVLVHLGASEFLSRYKIYVTHVQGWRQQFAKLESVDLRYEHQIIVNPDAQGGAKAAEVTPAVAKAAMAAGVKPAALIHVIPVKPVAPKTTALVMPVPATKPIGAVPDPIVKTAAKPAAKPGVKKAAHRARRRAWRKKTAAKTTAPAKARGPKQQAASAAKATAKPSAIAGTSEHGVPGKKKPSAAVAKIQVQQDRP